MPEPQGNAPVEGNKDRTNFTNTNAAKKNVTASRLDQTAGTSVAKGINKIGSQSMQKAKVG